MTNGTERPTQRGAIRASGSHGSLFLSYSRKDIALKLRVERNLRAAGYQVHSDREVDLDDPRWANRLERQLADSDVVLVLWSDVTHRSFWVRGELRVAEDACRPMLVLLSEGAALPAEWSELALIDVDEVVTADAGTCQAIVGLARAPENSQDDERTASLEHLGSSTLETATATLLKVLERSEQFAYGEELESLARRAARAGLDGCPDALAACQSSSSMLFSITRLLSHFEETEAWKESEDVLLDMSELYLASLNFQRGADLVEAGVKLYPECIQLHVSRAILAERFESHERTTELTTRALRFVADAPVSDQRLRLHVLLLCYRAHLALGEPWERLDCLERALDLLRGEGGALNDAAKQLAHVQTQRAMALMGLGRIDDAKAALYEAERHFGQSDNVQ